MKMPLLQSYVLFKGIKPIFVKNTHFKRNTGNLEKMQVYNAMDVSRDGKAQGLSEPKEIKLRLSRGVNHRLDGIVPYETCL